MVGEIGGTPFASRPPMFSRRTILGAGLALPASGAMAAGLPVLTAADFGLESNLPRDQSKAMQHALDATSAQGGRLSLLPGLYIAKDLRITGPLQLEGAGPGVRLIRPGGGTILNIEDVANASLSGLEFDSGGTSDGPGKTGPLVRAEKATGLSIASCSFRRNGGNGLSLHDSAGSVRHCRFSEIGDVAIFSMGATGLEVTHNHLSDIGNNGIQIWQREKREDGSLVAFNRIERVKGVSGGDGPYGNGINVFRAGSVIITGNRISDCRFSAIRDNAGDNMQIIANSCSRLGETAIYVEFGFQGAVVADNVIEEAGNGISVTNFNEGGRLAVVSGNVVRKMLGPVSNPNTSAIGISVEADTVVSGNVIEDAPDTGLVLGWGYALRNVSASGNIIRNCGVGISVSLATDAGEALITGNIISGARNAAILGKDHERTVTGDLALDASGLPARVKLSGNLVS